LPVLWLRIYKAISKHGAQYDQVDSIDSDPVKAALEAGEGSIILTSDKISSDIAAALVEKAKGTGAKVNVLLPHNNSWGLINMGVLPDRLPAQQLVTNGSRPKYETLWNSPVPANAGLGTQQILESVESGKVKSLYLMGSNPAKHMGEQAQNSLAKAQFLVVQDMFMNESAEHAHVFLPTCSFIEKNGHFTNIEGRVQRFNKAINPLGESRADWQILGELLARAGKPVAYFDSGDIVSEIALALAN
jgi:predicted molibdopterin-dependent oxidoreductase YjgC